MTQAIILAGGKGTRLAERLGGRPKPLVMVDGVPLLERQLRMLSQHGVDDVILLVNHAADQIDRFVAERPPGARVRLIDDGEPRGTAGATLACLDDLAERFLVVYGDTLFDIDIGHMLNAHEQANADATLLLHPNDHPADSDLVEIDDLNAITAFHPYPHPEGAELQNLVNAAFYVVERRALEPWRDFASPADFAKDLFPAMLRNGARLNGYVSYEYIKDLGTPKRLDKVEHHLRSGVVARASRKCVQAAVFLDRDGTVNALRDYIRRPEDFQLLPGAAEAIRQLNEAEYRVVLVTNQPVIARGEATNADMRRIHARLESNLGASGAYLDAIYYCPHHPDRGYDGEVAALKIACNCRKPGIGMFESARKALNIDYSLSWMVGDSTSDMLAAERAGLRSIVVGTGEGGADGKYVVAPDFHSRDLSAAARLITHDYEAMAVAISPLKDQVASGELVLIGGLARSGKSTAAAVLKFELRRRGLSPVLISLDRWILPEAERGEGLLGRYALDAARKALDEWLAGGTLEAQLPGYDRRKRERVDGGGVTIPPDGVLILEGVPALLGDWPTSRKTWRLHIDGSEEVRRIRVTEDLVDRGLADPALADQIYADRQRDEAPAVLEGRISANMILSFDMILREAPTT